MWVTLISAQSILSDWNHINSDNTDVQNRVPKNPKFTIKKIKDSLNTNFIIHKRHNKYINFKLTKFIFKNKNL